MARQAAASTATARARGVTLIGHLPVPTTHAAAVSTGGYALVIGGRGAAVGHAERLDRRGRSAHREGAARRQAAAAALGRDGRCRAARARLRRPRSDRYDRPDHRVEAPPRQRAQRPAAVARAGVAELQERVRGRLRRGADRGGALRDSAHLRARTAAATPSTRSTPPR